MTFSKHAQKRLQQRGFKYEYVAFILEYGKSSKKPGGAIEVRFSRKEFERNLFKQKINNQLFDKCKNKAVLLSNIGCVITLYNIK